MLKTIGIVVGILVGLASAGAAWTGLVWTLQANRAPFSPIVSFGQPIMKQMEGGLVSVVLPMTFSNAGAKEGCIADVALKVRSVSSEVSRTLYPTFSIDVTSYLRGMQEGRTPFESVEGPVEPVGLVGHATSDRAVLFMPSASPWLIDELAPGVAYSFAVYIVPSTAGCEINDNSSWQLATTATFVLNDGHLTALQDNLAVLPLDAARDRLRTETPP